jgi:GNAT superfamily N-acetyltransferase
MDTQRFRFSDDSAEMDRNLIHTWLSTASYWAIGRTREKNDTAMDNSLNFGIFDISTGAQVAYARVISDRATFAWLADVFVLDEARGEGVGVALIAGVTKALEPFTLKRIGLVTADAHGLYEKFGFTPLEKPEIWMARVMQ